MVLLNSIFKALTVMQSKCFLSFVKQLAESEGVTEQLKAENQMLWVQSMNNVTNCAQEIVLKELIYI